MFSIAVTDNSGVGEARRKVTQAAKDLGFSEVETANVAIIVVEAANNLIKHTALGGKIIIIPVQEEHYKAINILAIDKGKGIANFSQSSQDGYSTSGTAGTGLGAIKRLSSDFDIYSVPNSGTVLWSRVVLSSSKISEDNPRKKPREIDVGAICIPVKGERLCGDSYAVNIGSPIGDLFMVVDGLGHGDGAFEAAEEAVKVFNSNIRDAVPLEDLFQKIHLSLHKTRGAAAAIAKINMLANELEYVGIGNISSIVIAEGVRKSLVSLNGIVGHGIRKIQSFKRNLPDNFILIMYSDGLITHWDLDKYPGILAKSSHIIAGILYRDYERGRDDTTVLVIKPYKVTTEGPLHCL
jgi:anti-sigma regulatory factor (Ser/Thr protein kinase)